MFLFKCTFTLNYAHCPFNNVIFQGSNRSRQGRSGIMGKKSIFRRNRDKTPEPLQEYFSFFLKNLKYLYFNFIIILVIHFISYFKFFFRNFSNTWLTPPSSFFSPPIKKIFSILNWIILCVGQIVLVACPLSVILVFLSLNSLFFIIFHNPSRWRQL